MAARGFDVDDHTINLAWGIAVKECEATWTWFVEHVMQALACHRSGVTLVQDRQTGLQLVVDTVLDHGSETYGAQHIKSNIGSKYRAAEEL